MSLVAAVVAGIAVYALATGGVHVSMAEGLGRYLMPQQIEHQPAERTIRSAPWAASVVVGGLVGVLASQGDLFISGAGRSAPLLAALGGAAGYFVWSFRSTNAKDRAARNLRFELPIVADAIALHVVAGDSVSHSVRTVTRDMTGVAVAELTAVLDRQDDGTGLAQSLQVAAEVTAHADARRLYDLLAHAHESGGRLAEMLAELAVDLRAGIERDLTAEGGKRAVATYGPVLALMVPTALLFLLYPTLLGLRALSGTP